MDVDIGDTHIDERELRRQLTALLPQLRGFARFLTRDRVVADDLVQDALVRGLAALHQFQPDTSLKAWMFTILRNTFYEQRRRRKREAEVLDANAPGDLSASATQESRNAIADLQGLLWTLPPVLREALILVGAQELTHEEAALVCNVPPGTMKARLSRARVALALAVERAEGSM